MHGYLQHHHHHIRRALPDFSFWSNCQDQTAIFQDQTNLNGGTGSLMTLDLWRSLPELTEHFTLQNPTHIYSAAGTYNVLLWVTTSADALIQ
ncbi:MAG: hypothetical protein IPH88_00840 [Bacteroidales bacterium]|nr:hypothetical protein [Bacteroidales bacterium]